MPAAVNGLKDCSRCKENLPLTSFRRRAAAPDGLSYVCRLCHEATAAAYRDRYANDPEFRARRKAYYDAWLQRDPEAVRRARERARLLMKYGLTEADFAKINESQCGRCAICDGPPIGKTRLSVDHDHTSGQVRGLLCDNCNKALGCFQDNPEIIQNAIRYLNRERPAGRVKERS